MKEANTIEPTTTEKKPEAKSLRYVLVTPARNEARFIEQTIKCMLAQTIQPVKWVIVSDGSTDGTDEIVRRYAAKHPWIELVRMPERKERDFAGKVKAFNAGYAQVKDLEYDIIGNLDADLTFDADHIEFLFGKFMENPRLGVAGTNYVENALPKHDYRFANSEDVSGACQLFRRECFEMIGGYTPNRAGGVDLIATLSARMKGWDTRTFGGKIMMHYRPQGTAIYSKLFVEFYNGKRDYLFGCHPLWEPFRAVYYLGRKPFILGGCLLYAGYCWAILRGMPKSFPDDVIQFRRREQMSRLQRLFRSLFGLRKVAAA